jgi:hypothetical protein
MKLVLDSNMLRDQFMLDFLEHSKNNQVILTDYLMIEAYKAGNASSFLENMEPLSRFTQQCAVLKSTGEIAKLRGRIKGLTRRMIDPASAKTLLEFNATIRAVKEGKSFGRSFYDHQIAAAAHISTITSDATKLATNFNHVRDYFTAFELEQIRGRNNLNKKLAFKIMHFMEEITYQLLDIASYQGKILQNEFVNLFCFRFALCSTLLLMRWIRNGVTQLPRPERVRNDILDMNLCSYSTYFDGILTNDTALRETYSEATAVLSLLGARIHK